jgi:hypothetical protein
MQLCKITAKYILLQNDFFATKYTPLQQDLLPRNIKVIVIPHPVIVIATVQNHDLRSPSVPNKNMHVGLSLNF